MIGIGDSFMIKAKVESLIDDEKMKISIQAVDLSRIESFGNMVIFHIERKQHPEMALLS
ncbi:MAG: hypothetical protein QGH85_00520 [Candidatus Pacebacteria bacterium]|jgi:galactitol-specific phosphotransferase system IIB component|nr:hypothetical protein [Candidatus Paceibacterota bacterium]MDP7466107.1 hypothetical protein [Candidatus Paceibacterota bacterium]MDP7648195.1 hypothetical protein [Candidatus Paceibacterota bacterium]HJO89684.1 hypothetical protein [Candidatus Paceibacterota bacterium]|tara:strand:+ start:1777 stop:1953 length:177 start_codon:yes stop_codon:yes gene_type:complete